MKRIRRKGILRVMHIETILMLCILLVGCVSVPSPSHWAESGIGTHIDVLRALDAKAMADPRTYIHKIHWKETTYPLEDGNWVYVTPVGKGCFVHFEVNPEGIIVGYRLVGDLCY